MFQIMKNGLLVLIAAIISLLCIGCNQWNDCSEEKENNFGRSERSGCLYSSTHILLSDFTQQYWQLVDGDTLRLRAYLHQYQRQNGNDEDGYFLYLCGVPIDIVQSAKNVSSDYLHGRKMIVVSPREVRDPYNKKEVKRDTPYITKECYDTLKYKLCNVEGIIHFPHFADVELCIEQCYIHIPDWDYQLSQLIEQ